MGAEADTRLARIATVSGGALSELERLIVGAATGAVYLTPEEFSHVLAHVSQAGFDPSPVVQATGLAGQQWEGRILRGSARISSAARHYLRHVTIRQEWPDGTSFERYLASIRDVILDPRSGVFTSQYQGQWQPGVVRRSANLQGPGGFEWVMVEYRTGVGYWVTAFQPRDGLRALQDPSREQTQWLRRPR